MPASGDGDPFGLRSLDVERLRAKDGLKWASAPPGGYAAWIADMDFDVAPAIRDALREVIDGDAFGYPDWGGVYALSPAAKLFPQRMSDRYGWEPSEGRLHDMANVIQVVRAVVRNLTAEGDGVVLHMPAYYPFLDTMAAMRRRLVPVEPVFASDMTIEFDYERLEGELGGSGAKLWLLCNPHNPAGHVFGREELERVAEIAARHDLTVISDEIHADLTFPPHRHIPFASLGTEPAARTITTTSASKAFNLAGMRWAVLHAGSDAMQTVLENMPNHYLGAPNKMGVQATVAAWTAGDGWLDAVRDVLDENRTTLRELLAEHLPGTRYRPPDATYLTWIDARQAGLGDDPAATLLERGVMVSPGQQFGPQGVGHIRLNIATSPKILAATVRAMAG